MTCCFSYMLQRSFKYLIRQLIACSCSPRWKVSHVLQNGVESHAGLLCQLILIEEFLQQRLLQRFPIVSPQIIAPVPLGSVQGHLVDRPLGRRPEMVQGILLQGVRLLQLVSPIELRRIQPPTVLADVHRKQGEDVGRRLRETRQDVDGLRREVSPLLRPLTEANTPARVLNCFTSVGLVKNDQVTLGECQE